MTNEIKEMIESIQYSVNEDDWFEMEGHFLKPLLDYITNLQEENKKSNKIINELEKWLNEYKIQCKKYDSNSTIIVINCILNKLKALKEGK